MAATTKFADLLVFLLSEDVPHYVTCLVIRPLLLFMPATNEKNTNTPKGRKNCLGGGGDHDKNAEPQLDEQQVFNGRSMLQRNNGSYKGGSCMHTYSRYLLIQVTIQQSKEQVLGKINVRRINGWWLDFQFPCA